MNNLEQFRKELEHIINKYSMENLSNTPDFILANYLIDCMINFNAATQMRTSWYNSAKKENK